MDGEEDAKYSGIIRNFEERIEKQKKAKATEIFTALTVNSKKIVINDELWIMLRDQFSEDNRKPLIKFFSGYINQSGNLEMDRDFFVHNLIMAASQDKYGLRRIIYK
jgi:hypothetical protein